MKSAQLSACLSLLIFSSSGGLGLATPIFALFITDSIRGATLETVGIAESIYLVTRSVGQMPIGILIDRWRGQRDDMVILILGSFGFVLISLSYVFIDTVWQLYLVQFFHGLLSAASFPTWYAVFTRAIDKGKEGGLSGVPTKPSPILGQLSLPL